MESIIVAIITGVVTLVGVILSNSKSRAVMEVKIDNLTAKVEKHNGMIERSNVDMVQQLTEMIQAERAYQSAAEVIKIYDEVIQRSNSDVGRL